MAINNRTVTIKNVFASNAETTIPNPPVSGQSYRNTSLTAEEVAEGWPFKEIVDSAKFNEAMYEYTTICQQLEKYGFLPWSANTDYPAGGCALGTDGNVYQAKQPTGPSTSSIDPVTDTSHTYWDLFYYGNVTANRALVSNSNGKVSASSTTATEIGYVHGVTSSIQTQINNKANNNAVVHLNGTETITGDKTFSGNLVKQSNSLDYKGIHIQNTQITKGTAPSNTVGGQFVFQDKDGLSLVDRLGGMEVTYDSSGNIKTQLIACQPSATSVMYDSISIVYPLNGNPYTYAPTPTDTTTTSGTQIATTGWVNSANNNVVHKTGNETIAGIKTFVESYNINNSAVKGTAPSADNVRQLQFCDKNGSIIGTVFNTYATDKRNTVGFSVNKANSASDTDRAFLFAVYPASGNPYTACPASDVNGSIVTTVNKSKAANGYFQLGNGLIIQWGKSTTTNSEAKITLPKAFTTTNYAVVGNSTQALGNSSNRYLTGWAQVIARTTTNFTMYMSNYENSNWWNEVEKPFTWIAIGY